MFKFIFVLAVGLLASGIFAYNYFGDKKDEEEDFKDAFDVENNEGNFDLNDFDIEDLDLDDLDIDEEDKVDVEEEVGWKSDDEINKGKFSEKDLERVKSLSKEVVRMWIEEDDDEKKWEDISSASFFDYMKENIIDAFETRDKTVSKIDVFLPSDSKTDSITSESIIEVYYDGDKSKKAEFVVLVTFEFNGDKPLVSELVVL